VTAGAEAVLGRKRLRAAIHAPDHPRRRHVRRRACRPELAPVPQPSVDLVTDSAQYTVRFVNGLYRTTIGYTYTNRSGRAVSATRCHTAPPPLLEKKVGEEWVRAYSPVLLLCVDIPHFRIASGATYKGRLYVAAGRPGGNIGPAMEVTSIPGTYRLRWQLRAGDDPEARDAPFVEAISNEFQLIER
jgi:hypothetical protein